jgi:abequosyltransferase
MAQALNKVLFMGIAYNGCHRLAYTLIREESLEALHIRRVLQNEYPLINRLYIKLTAHEKCSPDDQKTLPELVARFYEDKTLLDLFRHVAYRVSPIFLLHPAEEVFKYAHNYLQR